MNKAVILTLSEAVTDPSIPRPEEIILHIAKSGTGTGLSCLGIDPVAGATDYPSVTIVKGKGTLYADMAKKQQITTNVISSHKGTFITCEEDCYISITNAQNIYRFVNASTWIGYDARHFFSRLDVNAPILKSTLAALTPAVNVQTINCWDYLANKTDIRGSLSDLTYLGKLTQLTIDQCTYVTGKISALPNFSTGTMLAIDATNAAQLQGNLKGVNLSGIIRLLLNGTQVISSFADLTTVRKNTSIDISFGEAANGDLSTLPEFTKLNLTLNFIPTYSRNPLFKQKDLRAFSSFKELPLTLFETFCADLNNSTNVTFNTNASIRLWVDASQVNNVSQVTRNHMASLVSKGVLFSTNVNI